MPQTAPRTMLSVAEAAEIINQNVRLMPTEVCPLSVADGKILREPIIADRDVPPFDRVTMDGVAFAVADFAGGLRHFPIVGVQAAGAAPAKRTVRGGCFEVMTGAVLPEDCDCVVPVEEITRSGESIELRAESVLALRNIHRKGSDFPAGSELIAAGTRLAAPHVAVCASVGKRELLVARAPRVALVATGDELVELDGPVLPHQIRMSNVYAVQAALASRGFTSSTRFHARDDHESVRGTLARALDEFDVLVVSGGVSAGRFDLVPEVLQRLGVRPLFHKVRQRPGLPFWFGVTERRAVFALPGNPVSTLACAYRYLLPYLNAAVGARSPLRARVELAEEVASDGTKTLFMPVRLEPSREGGLRAAPQPVRGSGDLAGLARSDGFVELPEGERQFTPGSAWPFYQWGIGP